MKGFDILAKPDYLKYIEITNIMELCPASLYTYYIALIPEYSCFTPYSPKKLS